MNALPDQRAQPITEMRGRIWKASGPPLPYFQVQRKNVEKKWRKAVKNKKERETWKMFPSSHWAGNPYPKTNLFTEKQVAELARKEEEEEEEEDELKKLIENDEERNLDER